MGTNGPTAGGRDGTAPYPEHRFHGGAVVFLKMQPVPPPGRTVVFPF